MDFILRSGKHWIYFTLVFFLPLLQAALGNWMYLGIASLGSLGTEQQTGCNEVPGLVVQQLEVCKNNPESIWCVSEGARRGIWECQRQFKFERWNCTTTRNQSNLFGEIQYLATRETAFIYAVLSAGVVHAVTESCSAGNLTDCSCDLTRQGMSNVEGWKWGGCSDNINYGIWFSKTFVDAPETTRHTNSRDIKNRMNLHNNEVGRQVVEKNMRIQCRCHGVSGSCAVKTCWKKMPSFHDIGKLLKEKYDSSVELAPRSRKKLRARMRDHRNKKGRVPRDQLVHLNRSPNYCRPDPDNGILGTRGRLCNRSSTGPDSCDLLCCGRGYNTQVVRNVRRCHCKFHWCCYVSCKTCETMIDKHTCK